MEYIPYHDSHRCQNVQQQNYPKYSTVTLPAGLTTIYGMGFARNYTLDTVNTVSSIRYIGAMSNPMYNGSTYAWQDDGYSEVWDSSVAEHFDNDDYRDMGYTPREFIQSQFGAFYYCTKLTTFNFKAITDLRKIGWAAFAGCKLMKNMSGNVEYVYKTYTNSGAQGTFTTLSISGRANNQGVIDLSGDSHLRSIDMDAFRDCNQVNFLHLPDNRGSATESQLYIGYDPDARQVNDGNAYQVGAIFAESKSIRVLIGEIPEYASSDFGGKNHNSLSHYPSNCFGKNNILYYHIYSSSDIPNNSGGRIKYWTRYIDSNSNSIYVLFDNETNARDFFNKGYTSAD